MNFVATVGIVPHYFEKRKSAAYAALGVGGGVGMVALPYILTTLLQNYGYKMTILYLSPLSLVSATAPIVFIPQMELAKPESAKVVINKFIKPFKLYVTPFYLTNAYFWNGAHTSVSIILFSFIVRNSSISVATLSLSTLGGGYFTATVLFLVYLIKFTLNHYILQICANILLAVVSFIFAFIRDDMVYYTCSFFTGIAHGIVIANMVCLSAHLYTKDHVESAFSFQEAVSGISGLIVPVTTGLVQNSYGDTAGLSYIGAHGVLAALILILPALFHPRMWKPVENNSEEHRASPNNENYNDKDACEEASVSMTNNKAYVTELNCNLNRATELLNEF